VATPAPVPGQGEPRASSVTVGAGGSAWGRVQLSPPPPRSRPWGSSGDPQPTPGEGGSQPQHPPRALAGCWGGCAGAEVEADPRQGGLRSLRRQRGASGSPPPQPHVPGAATSSHRSLPRASQVPASQPALPAKEPPGAGQGPGLTARWASSHRRWDADRGHGGGESQVRSIHVRVETASSMAPILPAAAQAENCGLRLKTLLGLSGLRELTSRAKPCVTPLSGDRTGRLRGRFPPLTPGSAGAAPRSPPGSGHCRPPL